MQYTSGYKSPLGDLLLAADGYGITGLWFKGQKYFALSLDKEHIDAELPVFSRAKRWLDTYFSGEDPGFQLPLHFAGTDFQREIWGILSSIPYGETATYGQVARQLAQKRGIPHMSAQAVGGAVAHNNISIFVPCHRVVGTNGSLAGYAGGISRKIALLQLEGAYKEEFFVPPKATVLPHVCTHTPM